MQIRGHRFVPPLGATDQDDLDTRPGVAPWRGSVRSLPRTSTPRARSGHGSDFAEDPGATWTLGRPRRRPTMWRSMVKVAAATALFGLAHSALASRTAKRAAARTFGQRHRNG